MSSLGRLRPIVFLLALGGCAQEAAPPPTPTPDTRPADEVAIRAAVKEWSAAAQAKDPDKFTSYYTDDAVVMLEDAPDFSGKSAIREAIGVMMKDPNFSLSFVNEKVQVARSGDLAYETGTFSMTTSDKSKKAVTEKGRYVVVWRKQADGRWKAALDAPVSDPAETPAPAK